MHYNLLLIILVNNNKLIRIYRKYYNNMILDMSIINKF